MYLLDTYVVSELRAGSSTSNLDDHARAAGVCTPRAASGHGGCAGHAFQEEGQGRITGRQRMRHEGLDGFSQGRGDGV